MFRIPSERLKPSAPPPAAPPPPIPEYDEAPSRSSYQQQYVTTGGTGGSSSGIKNYATAGYTSAQWKDVANQTYGSSGSRGLSTSSVEAGYGDVTVRPNTGQTNSAFGASLQEASSKLRFLNIVACSLGLLWSVPNILGQVAVLHLSGAVLAGYLTFFCALVFGFELHNKWIDERLKDSFGMLYHPLGRSVLLLLMGGMAIGQANLIDWILGGVFVFNAMVTTFCFMRYPEYRRMFEENQSDLLQVAKESATKYAWANPDKVANVFGSSSNSEQAALLSSSGNGAT